MKFKDITNSITPASPLDEEYASSPRAFLLPQEKDKGVLPSDALGIQFKALILPNEDLMQTGSNSVMVPAPLIQMEAPQYDFNSHTHTFHPVVLSDETTVTTNPNKPLTLKGEEGQSNNLPGSNPDETTVPSPQGTLDIYEQEGPIYAGQIASGDTLNANSEVSVTSLAIAFHLARYMPDLIPFLFENVGFKEPTSILIPFERLLNNDDFAVNFNPSSSFSDQVTLLHPQLFNFVEDDGSEVSIPDNIIILDTGADSASDKFTLTMSSTLNPQSNPDLFISGATMNGPKVFLTVSSHAFGEIGVLDVNVDPNDPAFSTYVFTIHPTNANAEKFIFNTEAIFDFTIGSGLTNNPLDSAFGTLSITILADKVVLANPDLTNAVGDDANDTAIGNIILNSGAFDANGKFGLEIIGGLDGSSSTELFISDNQFVGGHLILTVSYNSLSLSGVLGALDVDLSNNPANLGNYTFTIDPTSNIAEQLTSDLIAKFQYFVYNGIDFNDLNDRAGGSLTITIQADLPVGPAVTPTIVFDDDGNFVSGGYTGNFIVDSGVSVAHGGPLTVTEDTTVTYVTVLPGTFFSVELATLTVSTTGAYTFTVLPDAEQLLTDLTISFQIPVTSEPGVHPNNDFDLTLIPLNFTIQADRPTIVPMGSQVVEDDEGQSVSGAFSATEAHGIPAFSITFASGISVNDPDGSVSADGTAPHDIQINYSNIPEGISNLLIGELTWQDNGDGTGSYTFTSALGAEQLFSDQKIIFTATAIANSGIDNDSPYDFDSTTFSIAIQADRVFLADSSLTSTVADNASSTTSGNIDAFLAHGDLVLEFSSVLNEASSPDMFLDLNSQFDFQADGLHQILTVFAGELAILGTLDINIDNTSANFGNYVFTIDPESNYAESLLFDDLVVFDFTVSNGLNDGNPYHMASGTISVTIEADAAGININELFHTISDDPGSQTANNLFSEADAFSATGVFSLSIEPTLDVFFSSPDLFISNIQFTLNNHGIFELSSTIYGELGTLDVNLDNTLLGSGFGDYVFTIDPTNENAELLTESKTASFIFTIGNGVEEISANDSAFGFLNITIQADNVTFNNPNLFRTVEDDLGAQTLLGNIIVDSNPISSLPLAHPFVISSTLNIGSSSDLYISNVSPDGSDFTVNFVGGGILGVLDVDLNPNSPTYGNYVFTIDPSNGLAETLIDDRTAIFDFSMNNGEESASGTLSITVQSNFPSVSSVLHVIFNGDEGSYMGNVFFDTNATVAHGALSFLANSVILGPNSTPGVTLVFATATTYNVFYGSDHIATLEITNANTGDYTFTTEPIADLLTQNTFIELGFPISSDPGDPLDTAVGFVHYVIDSNTIFLPSAPPVIIFDDDSNLVTGSYTGNFISDSGASAGIFSPFLSDYNLTFGPAYPGLSLVSDPNVEGKYYIFSLNAPIAVFAFDTAFGNIGGGYTLNILPDAEQLIQDVFFTLSATLTTDFEDPDDTVSAPIQFTIFADRITATDLTLTNSVADNIGSTTSGNVFTESGAFTLHGTLGYAFIGLNSSSSPDLTVTGPIFDNSGGIIKDIFIVSSQAFGELGTLTVYADSFNPNPYFGQYVFTIDPTNGNAEKLPGPETMVFDFVMGSSNPPDSIYDVIYGTVSITINVDGVHVTHPLFGLNGNEETADFISNNIFSQAGATLTGSTGPLILDQSITLAPSSSSDLSISNVQLVTLPNGTHEILSLFSSDAGPGGSVIATLDTNLTTGGYVFASTPGIELMFHPMVFDFGYTIKDSANPNPSPYDQAAVTLHLSFTSDAVTLTNPHITLNTEESNSIFGSLITQTSATSNESMFVKEIVFDGVTYHPVSSPSTTFINTPDGLFSINSAGSYIFNADPSLNLSEHHTLSFSFKIATGGDGPFDIANGTLTINTWPEDIISATQEPQEFLIGGNPDKDTFALDYSLIGGATEVIQGFQNTGSPSQLDTFEMFGVPNVGPGGPLSDLQSLVTSITSDGNTGTNIQFANGANLDFTNIPFSASFNNQIANVIHDLAAHHNAIPVH